MDFYGKKILQCIQIKDLFYQKIEQNCHVLSKVLAGAVECSDCFSAEG